MAHLYKRGCKFWINYYLTGKLVQKSLKTQNERVALAKKKRIEYELALGDLHVASKTPLSAILETEDAQKLRQHPRPVSHINHGLAKEFFIIPGLYGCVYIKALDHFGYIWLFNLREFFAH